MNVAFACFECIIGVCASQLITYYWSCCVLGPVKLTLVYTNSSEDATDRRSSTMTVFETVS